jgi:uncharacterized protein YndB with AHSA1/START domain
MIKYELEFQIRSSVKILYNCLSTPSGLSEWFADDVNCNRTLYTFFWEGSEQNAELISTNNNQSVKFRWEDHPDDTYFEFKIEIDELTNDVVLRVTDFADENEEVEEGKNLWSSQVHALMKHLGS